MVKGTARGMALILVTGVLGLLMVLAVSFLTMAQLERRASRQRLVATKAYLLARSGLEDALARLADGQDPDAPSNRYGGENWDGSADGKLSALEAGQEVFHPTGANTPADIDGCPTRYAMRPSFFARPPGSTRPQPVTLEGRQRGYTGKLSGEASARGNHYTLKVAPQAGIYVNGGALNGGDLDGDGVPNHRDPDTAYNATLYRILSTLAEAIDREDGVNDGLPLDQADGFALVDQRPLGGWRDFEQVRLLALGGSRAKLEAFRPYLALTAWVDRKVIAPNASPALVDGEVQTWADIKMGKVYDRPTKVLGPATRPSLGFERVGARVVGRAPVDLAWARSRRPLLIALLAGLKGLYLDESQASNHKARTGVGGNIDFDEDILGTLKAAEVRLDWAQPTDDCRGLADQILASATPVSTWQEWNAFCDGLAVTGTTNIAQAKRDILKANFNPNSDLNKFNPNPTLWKSVDKSDLLAYSTEFSLCPVYDLEIESVGRVLGGDGRLLSQRAVSAKVSGPDLVRLTTQRELVAEDLGALDVAGDETAFRLPKDYFGPSVGAGKTWGHRLPGAAYAGVPGAGLQVYPEPYVDPGGGLTLNPANYDGNLQLATVETALDAWGGDMKLLARFADGFDLDEADATATSNLPDPEQVTTAQLTFSLLHASKPNTLYPDGCYAERARVPAWCDRGNANGLHGIQSFWMKPNYQRDQALGGPLSRGHPYVVWTNYVSGSLTTGSPTYGMDQAFLIADRIVFGSVYPPAFVQVQEVGHQSSDTNSEMHFELPVGPSRILPHTWHLLTAYWDFQSSNVDTTGRLLLDQGLGADLIANSSYNPIYRGANPSGAMDITLDDMSGPHKISLGRRMETLVHEEGDGVIGSISDHLAVGPDATFDEFMIYDTGRVPGDANTLAVGRFQEGRYYKGAAYTNLASLRTPYLSNLAGSYFSAPIRLPEGTVLRKVLWTWYCPPTLPDDYAEIEVVTQDTLGYLWGGARSRSTRGPGFRPSAQAWEVGLPATGLFRLHVLFRTYGATTRADASTPVLDSPVLDDLTLLCQPPGGAALSGWAEGS